jgi:hypothetical protein
MRAVNGWHSTVCWWRGGDAVTLTSPLQTIPRVQGHPKSREMRYRDGSLRIRRSSNRRRGNVFHSNKVRQYSEVQGTENDVRSKTFLGTREIYSRSCPQLLKARSRLNEKHAQWEGEVGGLRPTLSIWRIWSIVRRSCSTSTSNKAIRSL